MNLDDASLNGPAQRAFVRVLRIALPEDERCRQTLRDALESAGIADLPTDPEELLRFVQEHVAPRLHGVVPANLVLALTEDLAAEMDPLKGKDPSSSSRMKAATARPPPPGTFPADRSPCGPVDHAAAIQNFLADRVKTPLPALQRPGVAEPARAASAKLRDASSGPSQQASTSTARPTVFLVESDRLVRASLARSLVSFQFDVRVVDSTTELLAAVQSREGAAVAVVSIEGFELDARLQALVAAKASLRILARTDTPLVTEGILTAAGVREFGMVSKTASGFQLMEAVRVLVRRT